MNREEQIEEMAKIVDEMYNVYTTTADDIAEGLYNAGYRKTFTSDLASDTQKAFKEGYEKGCETCQQAWDNGYNDGYESGKDDGVKEFAEELKAKLLAIFGKTICSDLDTIDITDIIDELLKEKNNESRDDKYTTEMG